MTAGRPTKMKPEVLNKLEDAFALGASDEEACFYADISPKTLYNYQRDNPKFLQRKEALKQKPILRARQTFINSLDDPFYAVKYLEKKKRDEFGNVLTVEAQSKVEDDMALNEKVDKLLKLARDGKIGAEEVEKAIGQIESGEALQN